MGVFYRKKNLSFYFVIASLFTFCLVQKGYCGSIRAILRYTEQQKESKETEARTDEQEQQSQSEAPIISEKKQDSINVEKINHIDNDMTDIKNILNGITNNVFNLNNRMVTLEKNVDDFTESITKIVEEEQTDDFVNGINQLENSINNTKNSLASVSARTTDLYKKIAILEENITKIRVDMKGIIYYKEENERLIERIKTYEKNMEQNENSNGYGLTFYTTVIPIACVVVGMTYILDTFFMRDRRQIAIVNNMINRNLLPDINEMRENIRELQDAINGIQD